MGRDGGTNGGADRRLEDLNRMTQQRAENRTAPRALLLVVGAIAPVVIPRSPVAVLTPAVLVRLAQRLLQPAQPPQSLLLLGRND